VEGYLAPAFGMGELSDSALLDGLSGKRLAYTTDSYVVSPLFFPGGNIGDLAVNGTVNDLAVAGARPLYLSAGFIIEEGFPFEDFRKIVTSMADTARAAGARIVAGDTKVVDRGKGDGIFINTSGVGEVIDGVDLSPSNIMPGDSIIISGRIGEHGTAVMAERNGLSFDPPVLSDTAPLNAMVESMLSACPQIRAMRDPTRGGLATVLKEFALASGHCLSVYESKIPVAPGVRGACELMGLDPLYIANEGVLIAVVPQDMSEYIVTAMIAHKEGASAAVIGEVAASPVKTALLRTEFGGTRLLDMLQGEQLPRIC